MIKLPIVDIDNPPRSLGKKTEQEKERGRKALSKSLKRSHMGYTIENKKIVIWTEKVPIADPYPFNDEVTNYTYFYKNLSDRTHFLSIEARVTDINKMNLVAKTLNLPLTEFCLKSKKEHRKQWTRTK